MTGRAMGDQAKTWVPPAVAAWGLRLRFATVSR